MTETPDTTNTNPDPNQSPMTPREKILSGAGLLSGRMQTRGGDGKPQSDPIFEKMEKEHQDRINAAKMYQQNWANYHKLANEAQAAKTAGKPYTDPETGQSISGPELDAFIQKHNGLAERSFGDYSKIAGTSKETKDMIGKQKGFVDAVTGFFHHKNAKEQQANGGGGGAIPAPPQANPLVTPMGNGTALSSGGKMITDTGPQTPMGSPPPPKANGGAATPSASSFEAAAMGGNAAQTVEDQRNTALYQKKADIDEAKQKAVAEVKAGNKASTRPIKGSNTTALDARASIAKGIVKEYDDVDGNPIDVDSMPDDMSLLSFVERGSDGKPHTFWIPVSPNQTKVQINGQWVAVNPGDVSKIPEGAGTVVGAAKTGSTTQTTEPVTGLTTTSKRTPSLPPVPGHGAAPTASSKQSTTPAALSQGKTSPTAKNTAPPTAKAGTLPSLDSEGNIPEGADGQTASIVEAANRLMQGTNPKDLPAKVRILGQRLAEKYGWKLNQFTPRELTQLDIATEFLKKFGQADFSVLDDSVSRSKIALALRNPEKEGVLGTIAQQGVIGSLNPKEQEFVRLYRQAVQTISGLRQITSPGRATEAAISRLLQDLPGPGSSGSADAYERLKLLFHEINFAKQNRSWINSNSPAQKGPKLPQPGTSKTPSADDRLKKAIDAATAKPN